jgi:molybdopterin-guanine dinucleotide biosynthesis protein MobB
MAKKLAIVADIDEKTTPLDIAHKYLSHCDIVIIEGFKEAKHKKIEVIGNLEEEPLFANDSNIILVVSDMEIKTNLPVIKRDDIEKLTAFIEENF